MVLRTKIFEDRKTGVAVFREEGQIAVRNLEGEIIGQPDSKKFLNKKDVREAVNRTLGKEGRRVKFIFLKPGEVGKRRIKQ